MGSLVASFSIPLSSLMLSSMPMRASSASMVFCIRCSGIWPLEHAAEWVSATVAAVMSSSLIVWAMRLRLHRCVIAGQQQIDSGVVAGGRRMHHSDSDLGDLYRRKWGQLGFPKAITAAAHKLAWIIYPCCAMVSSTWTPVSNPTSFSIVRGLRTLLDVWRRNWATGWRRYSDVQDLDVRHRPELVPA